MKKILVIENISKYYGNKSNLTKAINNLSMSIDEGEFVAIMGASGSGKTTLLNLISTIDRVTSGHIYLKGIDITKLKGNKLNQFRREQLGFIFQEFNLLDTLTAYENIALALQIQKVSYQEIDKRVKEVASKLDISDILDKYPSQMSGGQKQRVASASYASKVIFIKDGQIFNEFSRGNQSRKEFFDKIIDVVSLLGGDISDVI